MKVVILSAGAVGGDVARELTKAGVVDEMVVADADIALARSVADEVGASAVAFDAADRASVDAVIKGADIVFNGVGPFYRYGMTIVRAAVDAGVHYVDVCDEFDVAEELMNSPELDAAAKKAGVTVLTGMGFAPGLTNLAARWAVDDLTSAHTVNIVLGVPYRVNMGVTINDHMLHSMTGNVTQFVDGAYRSVPAWARSTGTPAARLSRVSSCGGGASQIRASRRCPVRSGRVRKLASATLAAYPARSSSGLMSKVTGSCPFGVGLIWHCPSGAA